LQDAVQRISEYVTGWWAYPLPHDPLVVLAVAAGAPLILALIIALVHDWLIR